ncbi:vegetatible incompatibility het-E-1 [Fusarium tjaetaba]|uniref:Vegetatible incompatibility het-E-1 n=1 Tax=Fusarium tjaetaba TaxID=1567544 RepID=A0A8H5VZY5_9HYPO|nr:vegetatible incompatibility het-E-1 [Fusarium tjaetaba]KAF5639769.1 vegetatible incompatibility het-E-1 [Fusarium tjaetaba]
MADFKARRQENIKQNQILLSKLKSPVPKVDPQSKPASKSGKRKATSPRAPTRQSRRIAEASTKPSYDEERDDAYVSQTSSTKGKKSRTVYNNAVQSKNSDPESERQTHKDIKSIIEGWTRWKPEASEPTLDASGVFHFDSHPDFRPNKSPEEIIREGSFGGSYWRPLFSKHLGITVQDDWRELPSSWAVGLSVDEYLISDTYNPEINKYGVACGQSIEEWEAAGWIAHEYDVRGWFQWYCRFWMGRRCPDDDRQISRWKKCVGETGRWRRILLKKYVALGIRTVFADDGRDEDEVDVSPVVHQTCHHWAYEVRQDALERFWADGR